VSAVETVETWWRALRAQHVPVDPDQLRAAITVAEVLERTLQTDRLLATVQGIFAKNEREQKLLEAIAGSPAERQTEGQVSPRHAVRRQRRRAFYVLATALLTTALLAAGLAIWLATRARVTVAPVEPLTVKSSPPLAPESGGLSFVTSAEQLDLNTMVPVEGLPTIPRILILVLPAFLVLGAYLWWRARAPDWTRLASDAAEQRLYNNLPKVGDPGLFQSGALRSLGRALTGHTGELAGAIDIGRTVEATARRAGLLHIVEERPFVESPIHFAIERRSRDDHVGELYFRLADRLRAHGVIVQVTHYRSDIGSRNDEEGRRVGAPQPEPWQGRALIVAVGDGDTLFEPLGTEPSLSQLTHIETWPQKAFLSTRPVILWGDREEALGDSGVAVAPATSRGLGALADRLWRDEALHGIIGVTSLRPPGQGGPRPD
jgi:hypothetical protein